MKKLSLWRPARRLNVIEWTQRVGCARRNGSVLFNKDREGIYGRERVIEWDY